ncbi:MAG: hypothetical protein M1371_05685 [Actinobacteria bacterium]|nr:hypothetical protein [Actinomycetota bacterium]
MKKFLKSITFMILLIAVSGYMGFMLQKVYAKGASFFDLSFANLYLILWILLAIALVFMTACLVAVLVRPFWLAIISYVLSGIALFILWNRFGYTTLITSVVYVVVLMIFDKGVNVELRERIRFSIQPLQDRKAILVIFLVIMVCLSFYFGYVEITKIDVFKLPGFIITISTKAAEGMIGEELGQEGKEKLRSEISSRLENQLQNVAGRIYLLVILILTIILFSAMELLTSLLFWIPVLLVGFIFYILAKLKITKQVVETKEVSKVVLS